ncbi:hypothetical protein MMC09_001525 [Bachmanniomyces sp. S44760]|nr:hypothetical protein [Bachmanniomyces sp. S44760]
MGPIVKPGTVAARILALQTDRMSIRAPRISPTVAPISRPEVCMRNLPSEEYSRTDIGRLNQAESLHYRGGRRSHKPSIDSATREPQIPPPSQDEVTCDVASQFHKESTSSERDLERQTSGSEEVQTKDSKPDDTFHTNNDPLRDENSTSLLSATPMMRGSSEDSSDRRIVEGMGVKIDEAIATHRASYKDPNSACRNIDLSDRSSQVGHQNVEISTCPPTPAPDRRLRPTFEQPSIEARYHDSGPKPPATSKLQRYRRNRPTTETILPRSSSDSEEYLKDEAPLRYNRAIQSHSSLRSLHQPQNRSQDVHRARTTIRRIRSPQINKTRFPSFTPIIREPLSCSNSYDAQRYHLPSGSQDDTFAVQHALPELSPRPNIDHTDYFHQRSQRYHSSLEPPSQNVRQHCKPASRAGASSNGICRASKTSNSAIQSAEVPSREAGWAWWKVGRVGSKSRRDRIENIVKEEKDNDAVDEKQHMLHDDPYDDDQSRREIEEIELKTSPSSHSSVDCGAGQIPDSESRQEVTNMYDPTVGYGMDNNVHRHFYPQYREPWHDDAKVMALSGDGGSPSDGDGDGRNCADYKSSSETDIGASLEVVNKNKKHVPHTEKARFNGGERRHRGFGGRGCPSNTKSKVNQFRTRASPVFTRRICSSSCAASSVPKPAPSRRIGNGRGTKECPPVKPKGIHGKKKKSFSVLVSCEASAGAEVMVRLEPFHNEMSRG